MYAKLIISIAFLSLLFSSCNQVEKKDSVYLLPFIGPKKLANSAGTDTLYHSIDTFKFINQFGDSITEETTKNKIYVADFFFATCQSICPMMSKQMNRVQDEFRLNDSVILLSHTVNPTADTVEALAAYGIKYGAIKGKWHLMTGDKKKIYEIAKTSYLVNALQDDGTEEGFLHSESFLLVDAKSRLRGVYDGTDSLDINRLIGDINLLLKEK